MVMDVGIKTLLIVMFVGLAILVTPVSAETDWWNTTFTARKCFDINNSNTTTTLTNYTAWINLSYQENMESNFSYIALVEKSTNIEVPFFIRSKGDDSYANVMFKANLNNTLCFYWLSNETHDRQDVNNTFNSTVAAAWLFNETSGTTIQSYVNDSVSCTPATNATLGLAGKYAYATNFTGVVDSNCISPYTNIGTGLYNYTLEMWINPSRTLDNSYVGSGSSGFTGLLDQYGIEGHGIFAIWFGPGSLPSPALRFSVCNNDESCSTPAGQTTGVTSLNANTWHHLALTANLSSYNTGSSYFYYNGGLVYSNSTGGYEHNGTQDRAYPYIFGGASDRDGDFLGLIGDVVIQNNVQPTDYFKVKYYGTEETWNSTESLVFTAPPTLSPDNNTNTTHSYYQLSCSGATSPFGGSLNYLFWTSDDGTTYTLAQNTTSTTYNWSLPTHQTYLWKCQAFADDLYTWNTTVRYLNRNTLVHTIQAKSEADLSLLSNITVTITNSTTINISGPSGANYNINYTLEDIPYGSNAKVVISQNSSEYLSRTYYHDFPASENTTYTAYLPANSTAVTATFGVQNRQYVSIEGAVIIANKTIGSVIYTVGEAITDPTGTTTMTLTLANAYDIYVLYDGVYYHHGIISAAEDNYIITLNTSSVINMSSVLLNNINICVEPNNITINETNTTWYTNFTYNITSVDPKITLYGAALYCNGTVLLDMTNSTSSSYGGLIYAYADVRNCTYVTWQYWFQNSYAGYYGTYLNLTATTSYGLGLEEAFHLLGTLPKEVRDLIAIMIITITAVGLSVFNIEAAAAGTLVIGGILVYGGVLSWGIYLVTVIGAMSIIFIRRRY